MNLGTVHSAPGGAAYIVVLARFFSILLGAREAQLTKVRSFSIAETLVDGLRL